MYTLPNLPAWKYRISAIAIVALAAIILFVASLHNGFIALDDPYVIYNNLAIRGINPSTIRAIFTRFDPELYIPLTFFSFQIDYAIGGLNPFQFHLTNLLLHIGNSLLVLWIVFLLLKHRAAALVCALVFALHPINVEVVAWATARKEALSVFFALAAIVGYLYGTAIIDTPTSPSSIQRNRQRWVYYASIALFCLALLSKVTVFLLPALLLLIDWRQGRRMTKTVLFEKIPYAVFSLVFVCIGLIPKLQILSSTTMMEKVLMAARSTIFYLEKLLLPIKLSVLYPNTEPLLLSSPGFLISLIVFILLIIITLLSLRKTREIAFGFGFFLLALSPTFVHFNRNAAIQSATGGGIQIASDHYVYLPMIGLILLLGVAVAALFDRSQLKGIARELLVGGIVCIVLTLGGVSLVQSLVWRDSETLFAHSLRYYPQSIAARVNLSVIYRKSGRFAEEKKILQDGLLYGPNSKLATGMASIAVREGDTQSATEWYQQAMKDDPTNSEPYFGMAVMTTDSEEAEKLYLRAIALDPQYVSAYVNLASLYIEQERFAEAETALLTATSLNDTSIEAFFNLGALYQAIGDKEKSTAAFEHVLKIDPNFELRE